MGNPEKAISFFERSKVVYKKEDSFINGHDEELLAWRAGVIIDGQIIYEKTITQHCHLIRRYLGITTPDRNYVGRERSLTLKTDRIAKRINKKLKKIETQNK